MYSTFHFSHRSLVVRKDTISSTDFTLGLVIFPPKDIKQVLKVPSAEAHVISIIHSLLTRCSLSDSSDQSQLKCKQQTRPKKEAPQNNCHSENPFNCLLKTIPNRKQHETPALQQSHLLT